ncbi:MULTISPECIES: hypothetical protein [unclassified Wenzhouxiangella]|uniref:hypothetical protein n=1 Tax=unclassified Wenzhouxiangella TaxID=2613841 RepID=UPI0015F25DCF|nr:MULTISPECIES: hypothetical protein [unclassified Wenzhouxiangella]
MGKDLRHLVATFTLGENQQVLFRVRELDAKGAVAGMPRIEPGLGVMIVVI